MRLPDTVSRGAASPQICHPKLLCRRWNSLASRHMPAYDPDAEVAGLTLTIPSWMSSIDRTKSMAHLESISSTAKENLCVALTALEEKVQEMLTAIKEDS